MALKKLTSWRSLESGLLFQKRCYALCHCIDHIKSYTYFLPLQTYADNQQVRQIWAIQCYLLLGGALSHETCFMELVVFLTFDLTSQHSCQAVNLIPATYRKPKFVPSCGLWCLDESFGKTVPVLLSQLSHPLTTAVDEKRQIWFLDARETLVLKALPWTIYTYHMDTEFIFINLEGKAIFLGKERTLYICSLQ